MTQNDPQDGSHPIIEQSREDRIADLREDLIAVVTDWSDENQVLDALSRPSILRRAASLIAPAIASSTDVLQVSNTPSIMLGTAISLYTGVRLQVLANSENSVSTHYLRVIRVEAFKPAHVDSDSPVLALVADAPSPLALFEVADMHLQLPNDGMAQ